MKYFFVIATILSLFLTTSCASLFTALAQEPQKKETAVEKEKKSDDSQQSAKEEKTDANDAKKVEKTKK